MPKYLKGLENMKVRFFVLNYDEHSEVCEQVFKDAEGAIEYERHTVHSNGCKQICLTKNALEG